MPFAYLGILGIVVAQAAGKADQATGLVAMLFGSAALVGVAVTFHITAMLDGSRRAVKNIRKIEAALGLDETAQHKPCRYVGPIFAILVLAILLCVFGAVYFTCLKFALTCGG